jgi:hypothetical protein
MLYFKFLLDGQLRKFNKKTGKASEDEGFDFNVTKDHTKNQRNYEALGEVNEYRQSGCLYTGGVKLHKI